MTGVTYMLEESPKHFVQFRRTTATFASLALRGMIVWVLISLIVLCRILYPGFLDRDNIFNILSQNVQVGLIALGMTFVMIAGGFDLSVGAIYAAGATIYAMEAKEVALPLAALAALIVALAAGLANGLIITRLKVNPFIATLGTASIFGGATFLYSHSAPIIVDRPDFMILGAGRLFGVPTSLLLLMVIYAVGGLILSKTDMAGRFMRSAAILRLRGSLDCASIFSRSAPTRSSVFCLP